MTLSPTQIDFMQHLLPGDILTTRERFEFGTEIQIYRDGKHGVATFNMPTPKRGRLFGVMTVLALWHKGALMRLTPLNPHVSRYSPTVAGIEAAR